MKWDSVISICLSILAVLGTLYTYIVHTRKLNAQQKRINEYQIRKSKEEEDEKKKAIIEANVYSFSNTSWRMKIYNKGQATARNIRFSSPDIEKDDSGISIHIPKGQFPYPILHPQTSFELILALSAGHAVNPKITFYWDDDYKKDNSREQILNI